MVNKYKEFEGYFGDYSQYADALGFIDENDRVSKKERKLAASIFNDEDTQNYFLNVARDPNEFKLIFNGMCEPWLNPHCADMLLYAHKAKYEIEMSTTLIGMTMEDLAKIRHIPLQPLFIHVPSNDNDMQITIDDEYLTLLKTVINTMVCEPNVLYFKEIHPAIEPLILKVKKKGKFWDLHNRACHLDSKIKRKRRLKSCNRLQIGVLMPSGEVVLCCNDYAMQHVLGNLTKQSWDSLYKGEVFQQVISGWNNPSSDLLCWQCWDGCNN